MKFPTIEIVDRYCIAIVKSDKTNNANAEEIAFYSEQMSEIKIDKLHPLVLELIEHHTYVWSLEDDIKQGRIDNAPLEEIGQRALHVRDVMKQRVILKNALAELVNDPVKEIKQHPK